MCKIEVKYLVNCRHSHSAIECEYEKEKHKVDVVVTVDKKHSNNDIQGSEEEDKQ
jgi:hypothetical protein